MRAAAVAPANRARTAPGCAATRSRCRALAAGSGSPAAHAREPATRRPPRASLQQAKASGRPARVAGRRAPASLQQAKAGGRPARVVERSMSRAPEDHRRPLAGRNRRRLDRRRARAGRRPATASRTRLERAGYRPPAADPRRPDRGARRAGSAARCRVSVPALVAPCERQPEAPRGAPAGLRRSRLEGSPGSSKPWAGPRRQLAEALQRRAPALRRQLAGRARYRCQSPAALSWRRTAWATVTSAQAPARSGAGTANQCLDFYLQRQADPRRARVALAAAQARQASAARKSKAGRWRQARLLRERQSEALQPEQPGDAPQPGAPPGPGAGWGAAPVPAGALAPEADQARLVLRARAQEPEALQAEALPWRAPRPAWCLSWRRIAAARRRAWSPCWDLSGLPRAAERTRRGRRRRPGPGSAPFGARRRADPRGTRCRILGSAS